MSRSLRDSSWAAPAVAAATSLCAGWAFARHQELWMDETTQLSGLHLGPLGIVRWLLGHDPDHFGGIPGDRSPPVSYLLQWAWSRVFGLSEPSLRVFGVLIVAMAAAVVARAATRTWGGASGWVAGLMLALSPNAIFAAAEIRAYPLLLLWSAFAFSFLLRLLREAGPANGDGKPAVSTWVGLVLSLVAATYTHFFGIVLTGAVVVACAWFFAARRALWLPLLLGAAVAGVAECGVLPFVLSAVGASKILIPRRQIPYGAIRLLYRSLGGHPAWSAHLPMLAMGLAGAVVVLGVALAPRHGAPSVARALVIAVAAGLGAALVGRTITGSFDGLSASYNLWAVPAVVLAGASAVAARDHVLRRAGWTGTGLLLGASLASALVLARHGDAYAHAAGTRVNAELARLGAPDDLVVIIDGDSWQWSQASSPPRYAFGSALQQYLAERQPDGTLTLRHLPDRGAPLPLASFTARRVVVVEFESLGADTLALYLRSHQAPPVGDGHIRKAFEALGWSLVQSETLVALGAAHLDVLEPRR